MKYANHKFRATLGKARAVKPNEAVLVAYSGGLSSGAMVKLIQQGLEEAKGSSQKKLVFKPSLLYIDGKSKVYRKYCKYKYHVVNTAT